MQVRSNGQERMVRACPFTWATLIAGATYLVASIVLFGDPFKPIEALLFWTHILDSRYWLTPLYVGLAVGAVVAFLTALAGARIFAPAVFVAVAMPVSVILTVIAVDEAREREITKFRPDRLVDHSFRRTLLERRSEPWFYFHAAAMKDCVPYIWSYRQMRFYRLQPNGRQTFLPDVWLAYCDIRRPDRGAD